MKQRPGAPRLDPEAFEGINPVLVRALRVRLGFTVRQVAEKAKISTTTLVKMESGKPVRLRTKMVICFALGVTPEQVSDPKTPTLPGDRICVVRSDDSSFRVAYTTDRAPRSLSELTKVEEVTERRRLAQLGFATGFYRLIQNRLDDPKLIVEVLELCSTKGLKLWNGTDRVAQRHPGEEFVYCLRGPVTISVEEQSVTLETGDSAFFNGEDEHDYALGPSAESGTLGRLLSICTNPL